MTKGCLVFSLGLKKRLQSNQSYQRLSCFFTRSQKEITEFTVCESLKLVVMFIERLCLRSDTELICLSIRLLFLSFHKWGLDEEIKTEEKESLKERVTGRLFEKLGQKIGGDFPNQMADGYNQREKSLRELKV